MTENIYTRRKFLKTSAAATLALSLGISTQEKDVHKKSTVVLIRNADVIDKKGRINQKIVEQMLDESIAKLCNKKNVLDAWKQLFNSRDIVGVKSNVWRYLPTPPEVEKVIVTRLKDLDISNKNIDVDDRAVISNKIFQRATALINVRPLRAHNWSGIGGCIKNYIMFTPRPADYHPDSCADLGALWNLPVVKGKTRLNILILFTPQFHCIGPHHFDEEYTWQYKGLLVGTDPVAIDAIGVKLFELKRQEYFKEYSPLRPLPKHVQLAETRHNIGISDLRNIELIKLGWLDGALI